MANTDQLVEWIGDSECHNGKDCTYCINPTGYWNWVSTGTTPTRNYEQVLGGGFREVREECYHTWKFNCMDGSCCEKCGKTRFTDEELDFVRAFNSRQG